MVQHGALMSLEHLDAPMLDAHRLPHGLSVSPLCVVGGKDVELTLTGKCIEGVETSVLLKSGGQYIAASTGSNIEGSESIEQGKEGMDVVHCSFKAPQVRLPALQWWKLCCKRHLTQHACHCQSR